MKKVFLAATLLVGIAVNANAAESIRFASAASYPPFEFLDANNQIVGFDIDLANALCKQMQAECSFNNQVFDSLIASLKFKKYDAIISGMDITAERSKQVAFTQPYYANSAIVIAPKGTVASLAELKGKKLGVQNGTTQQKYMQDNYPEITLVAYDTYQNAILELNNGRIAAVFGDTAAVNEWIKNNPELVPVGKHITDEKYFGTGLGIAVRPDNQALLAKFNAALDAIKADGTYQAINDKWFPH